MDASPDKFLPVLSIVIPLGLPGIKSMEINPNEISRQSVYKLLTGSILPRPIGWISSVDERGNPNLAPFSFFNAVCANPPTVVFCPMIRGVDGKTRTH